MKFALFGDHPDGLDIARAMTSSGRHEIHAYSGPPHGADVLQRAGLTPKLAGDWEDVLADPDVACVIIASSKAARGTMLRRALQSERHVLCVHPADPKPDLAFEASMIQADTGCIVLPLLPEAFHPGVARFAHLAKSRHRDVLEMRRTSREEFWLDDDGDDAKPGVPGWDALRRIGGEIVEVLALAAEEVPAHGQPVIIAGKFTDGRLFHATYQANQPENFWRVAIAGARPLALVFPEGWPGPATLTHEDDTGALRTESWPAMSPWLPLIDTLDAAILHRPSRRAAQPPGETEDRCWTSRGGDTTAAIQAAETMIGVGQRDLGPRLGWTDEIRALELDDAIRRSLHYRRAYTLDLQDATEESTFKGTMTLVGCSLMWIILVLLFLSIWVPWLGWLIFPALGAFLVMQFLRRFVREKETNSERERAVKS